MSNLYKIARDTVYADSMDDASQILFGSNGIVLYSHEYYQEVMSRFVQKKEHIIKKRNGNLVFDLDDMNDMWNVVFIAEYVKKNDVLYLQLKELEKQKKDKQDKLNEIGKLRQELSNQLQGDGVSKNARAAQQMFYAEAAKAYENSIEYINCELELLENAKKAFDSFDWVKLNTPNGVSIDSLPEAALLKQAVHIINGLRNANAHGGSTDGKHVFINDKDNHFQVEIPIEYLDGFSKERIIANEDDRVIVETTNQIMSPILESLNYDISKLKSFFYNTDPEVLSIFLDMFSNDISKLYQLPLLAFEYPKRAKALWNAGIDVIKVPEAIIFSSGAIRLKEAGIEIDKVSRKAIEYPDGALELKNAGVDLSRVPFYAFEFSGNVIQLLDAKIDIYKLPSSALEHPERAIRLKKAGLEPSQLPYEAFEYPDGALKLKEAGIDICEVKKRFIDDPIFEMFHYADNVIELLNENVDIFKITMRDFDVGEFHIIDNLVGKALRYSKNVIELQKAGIDIYNVPEEAFEYPPSIAIKLVNAGIDICRFLDGRVLFEYSDEIIKLKEAGVDVHRIEELDSIISRIGGPYESQLQIKDRQEKAIEGIVENMIQLYNEGVDIYSLPRESYFYLDSVIRLNNAGVKFDKLPEEAFQYPDDAIRLFNADVKLDELPNEAFKYSNNVILLKNAGIDINRLSGLFHSDEPRLVECCSVFENPNGIIQLINAGINIEDIYKLPPMVFKNVKDMTNVVKLNAAKLDICKLPYKAIMYPDNVERLLELVNNQYERLDEFPIEFFNCNPVLLEGMFKSYNFNVARSVFGINNPKIIAAEIYANSVMKNYQKENGDGDIVDLNPMKFIRSHFNDTCYYRNNFRSLIRNPETLNFNSPKYLKQFFVDANTKGSRSSNQIKKYILDKIRNAAAHFRIKSVKDRAGNVVEDKICLFDKPDEFSDPDFFLVMDLQDFVEMIHGIEQDLQKKQSVATDSMESKSGRKR